MGDTSNLLVIIITSYDVSNICFNELSLLSDDLYGKPEICYFCYDWPVIYWFREMFSCKSVTSVLSIVMLIHWNTLHVAIANAKGAVIPNGFTTSCKISLFNAKSLKHSAKLEINFVRNSPWLVSSLLFVSNTSLYLLKNNCPTFRSSLNNESLCWNTPTVETSLHLFNSFPCNFLFKLLVCEVRSARNAMVSTFSLLSKMLANCFPLAVSSWPRNSLSSSLSS